MEDGVKLEITQRLPLQVAPVVRKMVDSAVTQKEGGVEACCDPMVVDDCSGEASCGCGSHSARK